MVADSAMQGVTRQAWQGDHGGNETGRICQQGYVPLCNEQVPYIRSQENSVNSMLWYWEDIRDKFKHHLFTFEHILQAKITAPLITFMEQ